MNVTVVLGLAAGLLLIGMLIGHGLNGRAHIARDKRQAQVQLNLNRREHRLQAMLLDLHRQQGRHLPAPRTLDRSRDDSVGSELAG